MSRGLGDVYKRQERERERECVCVCVCARACVHACMRVCVFGSEKECIWKLEEVREAWNSTTRLQKKKRKKKGGEGGRHTLPAVAKKATKIKSKYRYHKVQTSQVSHIWSFDKTRDLARRENTNTTCPTTERYICPVHTDGLNRNDKFQRTTVNRLNADLHHVGGIGRRQAEAREDGSEGLENVGSAPYGQTTARGRNNGLNADLHAAA